MENPDRPGDQPRPKTPKPTTEPTHNKHKRPHASTGGFRLKTRRTETCSSQQGSQVRAGLEYSTRANPGHAVRPTGKVTDCSTGKARHQRH